MNKVPKYVLKLLERRRKLALELTTVCCRVDNYCEKIGVDMIDGCKNSVLTDVTIYCEPWNAYHNTLDAIEEALEERRV